MERRRILDGIDQNPDHPITLENAKAALVGRKSVTNKRSHRKKHGKIGFYALARVIAGRWNNIDPATKAIFDKLAREEKSSYVQKRQEWKAYQRNRKKKSAKAPTVVARESAVEASPISAVDSSASLPEGLQQVITHLAQENKDPVAMGSFLQLYNYTQQQHISKLANNSFPLAAVESSSFLPAVSRASTPLSFGEDDLNKKMPTQPTPDKPEEVLLLENQYPPCNVVACTTALVPESSPEETELLEDNLQGFVTSALFYQGVLDGYDMFQAVDSLEMDLTFMED